ncbi:oxidoreductase [Telluribacter sp. SYSU D00476]|uniref:WD40/YVTN/BNR-like repeat-containing protein n=1 Tax=Telluribacter sp. SYSU D00476 TaxID=2811430 RepID=UPI001FF5B68E|nr:oxidoreductase [Telluribacter sp. SYSU D00476]
MLDINTNASFRSVHAPAPLTCWAGGTNGAILRTTNGGEAWQVLRVAGADSLDFRDIHAFDDRTAVAMSAGESEKGKARIYRTEDAGQTWQVVYQTTQKGIFLDGIDFWSTRRGICFGDPVDGRFFILTTQDGGRSWQELPVTARPEALPGEAAFAASGTTLITVGKRSVYIGTGGSQAARILRSTDYGATWQSITTRLPAGPSSGLFGLRFWSRKKGIAVGGDYRTFTEATPNVLLTRDGGKSWQLTEGTLPPGLKEAVGLYYPPPFGKKNVLLMAVGASGSGYSADQGRTWVALDQHPFHAVSFAGSVGYAVGGKGLVAKWGE